MNVCSCSCDFLTDRRSDVFVVVFLLDLGVNLIDWLNEVIEFSERLSYFGLATSLMIYLTKVLQEEMKFAAKNVNYWTSVTTLMPLVGGFLADGYLGRFSTVLFSTLIYLSVSSLSLALMAFLAAGERAISDDDFCFVFCHCRA